MKTTVNFYDFKRAFEQCRPDNFSAQGLSALWDYFEQFEEDTGTEMELDVVAISCDYSEDTVSDIARNYSIDIEGLDDAEQAVVDYLSDEGAYVAHVTGGFVYRNF